MSLIVLEEATLAFGGRTLFDAVSLRIGEGEKIGLIGRNGAGKSSLLRVMAGQQSLSSGVVRWAKHCRIGYLPQDVDEVPGDTVLGAVLAAVPGRADVEDRMREVEVALGQTADPDEQMELATRMAELGEELEHLETFYSERKAAQILEGLGFPEADHGRPVTELSGGWRMRVVLAGLLFKRPEVLFLDEPTNHLDMPSVEWLDGFLQSYPNSYILICHDRTFLNRHVERVLTFEPEGLRQYVGDYESYLKQREEEEALIEASQQNAEKELAQLQRFVDRFKAKASKARQAQSRAKRAKRLQEEMEDKRPIARAKTLKFTFPEVARSGRDVIRIEHVSKAFGDNRLYDDLTLGVYAGDRIAIIGRNGVGKTTLLKIIAHELAPDAGEIEYGANVQLGYYAQHHGEQLHDQRTVLDEVWDVDPTKGQATIRGICGAFLFPGDDVEKRVGILSGGERARVLLARLLVKPGNLLMMDEPTNHLDLDSAEALAEALEGYGGTLVFVSHNLSFVNRLATRVWEIEGGKVVDYPGNLDDYHRLKALQKPAEPPPRAEKPAAKPKPEPEPEPKRKPLASEPQAQQPKAKKKRRRRKRGDGDRLEELQARLGELQAERKRLEADLADPTVYDDKRAFERTLAEFEATQAKIDELEPRLRWQKERAT